MKAPPFQTGGITSVVVDDEELPLALPAPDLSMSQDSEWCVVRVNGEWRQIRFHDYHEIYEIPGLYERIFYDVLRCNSPKTIRTLLEEELKASSDSAEHLRVLDLVPFPKKVILISCWTENPFSVRFGRREGILGGAKVQITLWNRH